MEIVEVLNGEIICGATFESCICCLPENHKENYHQCCETCNGQWIGNDSIDATKMKVIRFPLQPVDMSREEFAIQAMYDLFGF